MSKQEANPPKRLFWPEGFKDPSSFWGTLTPEQKRECYLRALEADDWAKKVKARVGEDLDASVPISGVHYGGTFMRAKIEDVAQARMLCMERFGMPANVFDMCCSVSILTLESFAEPFVRKSGIKSPVKAAVRKAVAPCLIYKEVAPKIVIE